MLLLFGTALFIAVIGGPGYVVSYGLPYWTGIWYFRGGGGCTGACTIWVGFEVSSGILSNGWFIAFPGPANSFFSFLINRNSWNKKAITITIENPGIRQVAIE